MENANCIAMITSFLVHITLTYISFTIFSVIYQVSHPRVTAATSDRRRPVTHHPSPLGYQTVTASINKMSAKNTEIGGRVQPEKQGMSGYQTG